MAQDDSRNHPQPPAADPDTNGSDTQSSGTHDRDTQGKLKQTAAGSDAQQSPPAKAKAKAKSKDKQARPAPRRSALAVLCLLLIIILAAGGGWFGWQMWQQLEQLQRSSPASTPVAPAPKAFDPSGINRQLSELKQQLAAHSKRLKQLQNQRSDTSDIQRLGSQLAAMQQRLQAFSDTSRDDWKLAEAAFLLRLASQRMLLEHNSGEAIALSQAADRILRDQQDPDLFAVRQTLAQQLTALKMVQPIDREGLYSRLQALINQVEELNKLQGYQREPVGPEAEATQRGASTKAHTPWQKVKASVNRAFASLGRYIRVSQREQKAAPLLPPEQRYFLTQNLRLMLEQAQLGLLREQPSVYRQSLAKAQQWIGEHFAKDKRSSVMLDELAQLQQQPIQVALPNINQALKQLQSYIKTQHQVKAGDAP
jgi:uroporphyrin-3 C-methyltransferase